MITPGEKLSSRMHKLQNLGPRVGERCTDIFNGLWGRAEAVAYWPVGIPEPPSGGHRP